MGVVGCGWACSCHAGCGRLTMCSGGARRDGAGRGVVPFGCGAVW